MQRKTASTPVLPDDILNNVILDRLPLKTLGMFSLTNHKNKTSLTKINFHPEALMRQYLYEYDKNSQKMCDLFINTQHQQIQHLKTKPNKTSWELLLTAIASDPRLTHEIHIRALIMLPPREVLSIKKRLGTPSHDPSSDKGDKWQQLYFYLFQTVDPANIHEDISVTLNNLIQDLDPVNDKQFIERLTASVETRLLASAGKWDAVKNIKVPVFKNLSHLRIKQADLSGIYLEGAALFCTVFDNVKLCHVNLQYAHFSSAYLTRVDLDDSNLFRATFNRTRIYNSFLQHANLCSHTYQNYFEAKTTLAANAVMINSNPKCDYSSSITSPITSLIQLGKAIADNIFPQDNAITFFIQACLARAHKLASRQQDQDIKNSIYQLATALEQTKTLTEIEQILTLHQPIQHITTLSGVLQQFKEQQKYSITKAVFGIASLFTANQNSAGQFNDFECTTTQAGAKLYSFFFKGKSTTIDRLIEPLHITQTPLHQLLDEIRAAAAIITSWENKYRQPPTPSLDKR